MSVIPCKKVFAGEKSNYEVEWKQCCILCVLGHMTDFLCDIKAPSLISFERFYIY